MVVHTFFINVYGPYDNKVSFWEGMLSQEFVRRNIVMDGDLNFSMRKDEIWEGVSFHDPLANYFLNKAEVGLLDVELVKLIPTWRNMRLGEDRVAKEINHFLIFEAKMNDRL
jgi:hypothetical protein